MVNSHRPPARVARGAREVKGAHEVDEVLEAAEVLEVVIEDLEVVPAPALVEVLLEAEVPPVAPLEVSMPLTRRHSLLLEHRILFHRALA